MASSGGQFRVASSGWQGNNFLIDLEFHAISMSFNKKPELAILKWPIGIGLATSNWPPEMDTLKRPPEMATPTGHPNYLADG